MDHVVSSFDVLAAMCETTSTAIRLTVSAFDLRRVSVASLVVKIRAASPAASPAAMPELLLELKLTRYYRRLST